MAERGRKRPSKAERTEIKPCAILTGSKFFQDVNCVSIVQDLIWLSWKTAFKLGVRMQRVILTFPQTAKFNHFVLFFSYVYVLQRNNARRAFL